MKKIAKICLWGLALLIPIAFDPSVVFPYISPKSLILRLLITITAVIVAYLSFSSKQFRQEAVEKFKHWIKNPVTIVLAVFFVALVASTVFASDSYVAFYGDAERAGGLLTFIYLAIFFISSLLIFEKEDWITFFGISLIPSAILSINGLYEFVSGVAPRPGSFTGNPLLLSQYLLFSIFSALILTVKAIKKWVRVIAWLSIPLFLAGILITQTRGMIVGVAVGIFGVLIYTALKKNNLMLFGKFSARAVSAVIVIAMILVGGIWFSTRNAQIWQHIPGISRFSTSAANENSLLTREAIWNGSLKSINPADNGFKKFILGWGPENFAIAFNGYYDLKYYAIENSRFDKAHNQLIDIAVTSGIIGLIAYLAVWAALFWVVLRKADEKEESNNWFYLKLIFVFFGASYFVQNLVGFDTIVTYIPFVVFLAYGIKEFSDFQPLSEKEKKHFVAKNTNKYCIIVPAVIVAIFSVVFLISSTFIPYLQLKEYHSLWDSKTADQIYGSLDSLFTPYDYVQPLLRGYFMQTAGMYYQQAPAVVGNLFWKGASALEESFQKQPLDERTALQLNGTYVIAGRVATSTEMQKQYYDKALGYAEYALKLVPNRLDVRYIFAYALSVDGHNTEAISQMEQTLAIDPTVINSHYFLGLVLAAAGQSNYDRALSELELSLSDPGFQRIDQDRINLKSIYDNFLQYFYNKRDTVNFIKVAQRLTSLLPGADTESAKQLNIIVDLAKQGLWSNIMLIKK